MSEKTEPNEETPTVSTPPKVAERPTPTRMELRRAQLAAEEKVRFRNSRLQNLKKSMDSVRALFAELDDAAKTLHRLARRCQEAESTLRGSRDVDFASRVGYRAVCSAVFGSTQMLQSVLKYRNRLNDVEQDIREELESK